MKTDMPPYGVTELTPEKGDRNFEGVFDRLWAQLTDWCSSRCSHICAVWSLAPKPHGWI